MVHGGIAGGVFEGERVLLGGFIVILFLGGGMSYRGMAGLGHSNL